MCENKHPIKEMNSHHIYPKANIRNKKKVYILGNGITLCWRCHRKLVHVSYTSHTKYVAMFRNRMRNKAMKRFNRDNQRKIK